MQDLKDLLKDEESKELFLILFTVKGAKFLKSLLKVKQTKVKQEIRKLLPMLQESKLVKCVRDKSNQLMKLNKTSRQVSDLIGLHVETVEILRGKSEEEDPNFVRQEQSEDFLKEKLKQILIRTSKKLEDQGEQKQIPQQKLEKKEVDKSD